MTQIHVRERTSGPAFAQLGEDGCALGRLTAPARPQPHQEGRGDEERRSVERERPPRPDAEHERRGQRRAGELGDRLHRAERRARGLDLLLGHGLRHEAGERRPVERLGRAEARLDHGDVPDLDSAGEDQQREQRVQAEAGDVGGHDHEVARQPVRPHAADEQEPHERHRVAREHDADVARRPDLGHVERERDEHQPVADRAQALAREQEAELAVGEQPAHHPP
jgi:hypothetical protein